MAVKAAKISVTVPPEVLEEARRRASGSSLSAYVTQGLQRQLLADRQAELMDDWESEFGPITDEEMEQARHWLAG
jgi:post-segregation antitoxin (ccd killing protein)